MDRRDFLATATVAGVELALPSMRTEASSPNSSLWYAQAYRRNVIDMHITDWNPAFLAEFNPQNYVEMLKKADVQSAVVYAHSHVGLCYFPTKVGKTHRAYGGQDY